jgi:prevent-host-death family protein
MNSILNMTDAKARFSGVGEQASQGRDIIITRVGKPVVRITRYEPDPSNQRFGLFDGQLRVADDFFEAIPKAGYCVLQIEIPHLTAYLGLTMRHRDPFDRLLVSQA